MIAALLFCCLFAACTPKNDVNEASKDTLKIEILKIGKADCSIITEGKITEENNPKDFFEHPQNDRTKEFLRKVLNA